MNRLPLFVLIAAFVILLIVLVCALFVLPSHGPLAHAAPAAPSARWTPRGALVTWQLDTATVVTLSRCRQPTGCWLLYSGAAMAYLDDGAVTGDQYSLGRFVQDDGALSIVGWSKATLSGGRVWLPAAGR